MPSFDIVSQVDGHELANAIDQANREVANRFDFKGSNACYELTEGSINLKAQSDFQLNQMVDIVYLKLTKRNIDIGCLKKEKPELSGREARQSIVVQQGIDSILAKKIVKLVKDSKLKVQASIQGDKVRVTGKKRDDLQKIISLLKNAELDLPLQYENFRD